MYPEQDYESTILRQLVNRDSPATRQLMQAYFTDIHPYWSILHRPTFDINSASDMLLASIVMLSSWVQGGNEHIELAPTLFSEVLKLHLVCNLT